MIGLADKISAAYAGQVSPLSEDSLASLKAALNSDWEIDANGKSMSRKFVFKAFAKAVYTANLAAFISDKEGHHADVAFGWGYCHVTFSSHELGRLSENDFICAAKLDAAVEA